MVSASAIRGKPKAPTSTGRATAGMQREQVSAKYVLAGQVGRRTPCSVTLPSDVTVVSGKPVPSHGLPGEVEKTSAISASESAPSSSYVESQSHVSRDDAR